MQSENLYKISKNELPRIENILTRCFAKDPLYCKLIPDERIRQHLLPELFKCDVEEMFSTCEIFADSEEINSLIIVSDETEPYNHIGYYLSEFIADIKTDEYLIKEDHSLKTLANFFKGREYLNSAWTELLHNENRIHIIYLAVEPEMQHHELAEKLLNEVINYADSNELLISLETHNEHNISFYKHFGFKLFEQFEHNFGLTQYCMVRSVHQKLSSKISETA